MLKFAILLQTILASQKNFDQVTEIRTNVRFGDPLFTFKPMIRATKVSCKGYPAVDATGNVSAGLPGWKNTFEQCRQGSQGQLYGRRAIFGHKVAYSYCAYLPQSLPTDGKHGFESDWACVAIWVYKGKIDEVYSTKYGEIPIDKWKVIYGHHLRLVLDQTPETSEEPWKGTWLAPVTHLRGLDEDHLPLVDVDRLPKAARQALEWSEFNGHPFPLSDRRSRFTDFLGSTYNHVDIEPEGIDAPDGIARAEYHPDMSWDP